MKVYLAGPMTGYPLHNFPAFHAAAAALRAIGHSVFSPAERDLAAGFDPARSIEDQGFDLRAAWIDNLAALQTVDAIALMPGWKHSDGAKLERAIAMKLELEEILL